MPYRVTEKGERRRSEMRARIVGAATELFAERGYQATLLRDVVARAGTSIGNCYFYFPNKEALLAAVVEQTSLELGAAVDRALAGRGSGPGAAAIAVYTGVRGALSRPVVARLLFLEAPQAGLRSVALAHFVERARRFFEAAPELYSDWPPELMAQAWVGTIFRVIEAVTTAVVDVPPEQAARFCARWNLQSLGLPATTIDAALADLESFIAQQEQEGRNGH